MKRLLYLATLSLVASLLFAPAALAQEAGPTGGEGPCTAPFERFIQQVNGCVAIQAQPFPGENTVFDADTREPLGTLDEVLAGLGNEAPTASTQQYNPAPPQTPAMADLPETGGPALLLPAAGLLLATGLIGMRMVRRRS